MAVIITGASKGIGYALAKKLTAEHFVVYSFSRTAPPDQEIRHIFCDLSEKESIDNAFREFSEKEEKIDILVNNAGMGISGASEFADDSEIKNIFDVNFFGAVRCSQIAAGRMREQRSGKIIFISSATAVFPVPFQAFYTSTKSALSAFSESLRMELRPFGVGVGTILLCDTRTDFTNSRRKNEKGNDIYGNRIERSVSVMEHDEQNGMSAERTAVKIAKCLKRKRTKGCTAIGSQFRVPLTFLLFLNRILPRKWVLGIIYRIYGK